MVSLFLLLLFVDYFENNLECFQLFLNLIFSKLDFGKDFLRIKLKVMFQYKYFYCNIIFSGIFCIPLKIILSEVMKVDVILKQSSIEQLFNVWHVLTKLIKPNSVIAGNDVKDKCFNGSLAKASSVESVIWKFPGHRDKWFNCGQYLGNCFRRVSQIVESHQTSLFIMTFLSLGHPRIIAENWVAVNDIIPSCELYY